MSDPRFTVPPSGDLLPDASGSGEPAKLVVVEGPDEGKEVPLEGTVEVGSDGACTMVLSDAAVSRRHVLFARIDGGRIMVRDKGSRNGTFLGGTRVVQAEVPLGAVLTVGNSSIAVQPRWYAREVAPSTARRFGALVGESVSMREVFAMLERAAASDVTLLIDGESGTGKELAARSVHEASSRSAKPYVVCDCGSIPRELAESELFGHVRGAFSGAVADRQGAFARANGGTICLDEIGELPLELQPKLLRVLETQEVRPVGGDGLQKVDVRVIAATNRDLHAEARRGRFRPDLLYRLEVVHVRIPPLRQRPEDIPMLAAHLLQELVPDGDQVEGENLQRLIGYSWPGNVRELRNTLNRAVALARAPGAAQPRFSELVFNLAPGQPAPSTIGFAFPGVAAPMPYKQAKEQLLASFDREYVDALLARHGGNHTQAARAAELSRKHLYELVRRVRGDEPDDSE